MMIFRDLIGALRGVGGLIRFDTTALRYFEISPAGFAKSFLSALLIAPGFALMVWLDIATSGEVKDPSRFALLQAVAYIASWSLYPLLMVFISRHLERRDRFVAYIVAFNWFQLFEFAVELPAALLAATKILPPDAIMVLWLTTHSLLFVYEWFIARRILGAEAMASASLVVISTLLDLLLYKIAVVLS